MSSENNITILIQARTGSTRLPNKMLLPIFDGKTILEIIISNLLIYFKSHQIVLATTINPHDSKLEKIAKESGINCFRGDEQDVLYRFIKAGEFYNSNNIIRVCADNPLLQADYVKLLADEFLKKTQPCDYLSFAFPDGTPVIKSHLGLFAEATTLSTLRRAKQLTTDKFYHEHVTNYIYGNPKMFDVDFLSLPNELKDRKEIRLTIDTQEDFDNVKKVLEDNCTSGNYKMSVSQILNYIENNNNLLKSMAHEIERNSK